MGRNKKTPARAEPTLPAGRPRVSLAAPAGQPTAHFEASRPVTLIGSRRDCDLFICMDDVSKVHCALVNSGSAIIATDLCSRCGTFVNGERFSVAALHPGDELHIGSVPVEVRFLDPPESLPAAAVCGDDAATALPSLLRLTGAEQQYELTTLPAVIGRRHACHVVLDTPDVSLAHALLFTIDGCPTVFDLGSRSGTYLNSVRVTLAWLRDGDELCIGGEKLLIAWEGPQFVECEVSLAEAAGAAESADVVNVAAALPANGPEDLGPMITGLKARIAASQTQLGERAAGLERREVELEKRSAELEQERARLAVEKQQCEEQAAELQAAMSGLEEDRARFEAERAQFELERKQFDSERATWQQRLAEYETMASALRAREVALDEREAALAAAEREVTEKQAELAKRELANADATQAIEQFKDALSAARRAFTSVEISSEQPAGSGALPVAPEDPVRECQDEASPAGGGSATRDGLPAPLVDQPLFSGLDPSSPEQWPPELRERLRILRRESNRSDTEVISQVLAEFRARQFGNRGTPGN